MQIALLADIHGNIEALQAVLRDLEEKAPDATIVCAGDVVGYGPDPEACLALLHDVRAHLVIGNHEQMVLGLRDLSQCAYAAIVAALWTRKRLSPPASARIASLPSIHEPAKGVVVCHGNLRDAGAYVSDEKQAREALRQLASFRPDARVLVCGHTHRAGTFSKSRGFEVVAADAVQRLPEGEPCVLNPGAVGQAREGLPLARYALLELESFVVRFTALPYDHPTTLRKLRKSGLVARVVMSPPRGFARELARVKARLVQRGAARSVVSSKTREPLPWVAPERSLVQTRRASVSAVVVTYNSSHVVGKALTSLKESYDTGLLAECLVIDNHSSDGTPHVVRAEHPWCTVIESDENLGFGRACNVGIARTRAPHVLLLNPDATLARVSLARLLERLEDEPRAGAVAPAIVEHHGKLQPAGGMPSPRSLLNEALGRPPAPLDRRTPVEPGAPAFRTNWLCGAVVLLRRRMLEHVGAFDPRYFLYFEETDLWLRAQQAGWELWASGEAVATHAQGESARSVGRMLHAGCLADHFFRSRFLFLRKHFGWVAAMLTELAELGILSLRAARHALTGRDASEFRRRLSAPLLGWSGLARALPAAGPRRPALAEPKSGV